jgi:hypothetical protein
MSTAVKMNPLVSGIEKVFWRRTGGVQVSRGLGVALRASKFGQQRWADLIAVARRDAAGKMHRSVGICESTFQSVYMRCRAAGTLRTFYLAQQLPTGLRYSTLMFRLISSATSWASNCVDEGIAL